MLSYFDTSLAVFLSKLHNCIAEDNIQNSFKTFRYPILFYKNKLYKAIEAYKNNGTIFYSELITKNPEFTIKRIGEINMFEYCTHLGKNIKGVSLTGTYYLEFTVYYEK